MQLLLKRIARKPKYTIGKLYVNGIYVCDTIEDYDRLYFGLPKVKNETAVPCGTYEVRQDIYSPRFGGKAFYKNLCNGYLPRLMKTPLFEGVLVHCGNSADSSSGCIIVGENKVVGKVINSQKTFTRLMQDYLLPAKRRGEKVYITIQ